jgi:hypothetical protein
MSIDRGPSDQTVELIARSEILMTMGQRPHIALWLTNFGCVLPGTF